MNGPRSLAVAGLCVIATLRFADAHTLMGCSWPSGNILLRLQLDATAPAGVTFPLLDGGRSWNRVAEEAIGDWNLVLRRSRLTSTTANTATMEYGDGVNQVTFATQAYGMEFTERFLAITYLHPYENDNDATRTVEADVAVNLQYAWNSYRGTERAQTFDLRRVLVHEFGHVLGLGHPDQATPVQFVTAIMNSSGGRVESVQADDRAGAEQLYDAAVARPVITTQPASRTLDATGAATLSIAVNGQSPPVPDAFHSYRWYFKAPGAADFEMLFTMDRPGHLPFNLAQPADSGTYFYRVITPDHTVDSEHATLTVNPIATNATTKLSNLSTRGITQPGSNSMFVGFVVAGSRPKRVLVRAIGPTLRAAPFNVASAMFNPQLVLKNSSGTTVGESTPVWDQSPDVANIRAATARVGAFALPGGTRDAVVLANLAPGSYTAETRTTFESGVVLVEVYDADEIPEPGSRLANLSTRGFVDVGQNLLIAGFVVNGAGPRDYLIRVAGDTLKSFGVTNTLDDPYLRIYRADGTLIRELDDWDSPAALQPGFRALSSSVGAFALTDRQECVMRVTLPPGSYTAHVQSFEGPTTVPRGVALIELYELP